MDETTLDLRDIFKVLKKRATLIIGLTALFAIITAVVSFLIPPTYEATTALRIRQAKGIGSSLLGDSGAGASKQQMSTYAEILKSRSVVEDVIETMPTKDRPSYGGFVGRITTVPVKDTEILNVKVQAGTPEEAQFLTNTLVEKFLLRMTELVRTEQSKVREFVGQRMESSKKDLEKAESALQEYKQKEKIISPTDETKAIVDKLSGLDKLYADNRVSIEAAQAKIGIAQQQMGQQKHSYIADNPLIAQHKSKLAELEVELVSLSQNLTGSHPKVLATKAAINETRKKLNDEITRVVNMDSQSSNPLYQGMLQSKLQAEAELSVSAAREQALNAVIADSEKQLTTLPAKEHGLVRVMRDATVAQEIYVMLAKRFEEARISEVMEPTDVQVVDVATVPTSPIKPRKALNVAIAVLLGLFLGAGLAFALEYMRRTIRTADDVEHYLGLPVLGSIPDMDSQDRRKSSFFQFGPFGDDQQQSRRQHQRHS